MNWLLFACLVIAAVVFMPWNFTLGLLIGGAISSLNFHFLKKDMKTLLLPGGHEKKIRSVVFVYLRLGLTVAALYYIISRELADIFGLLIGLSLVIVGLFLGIVWEYRLLLSPSRTKSAKRETLDKGDDLK